MEFWGHGHESIQVLCEPLKYHYSSQAVLHVHPSQPTPTVTDQFLTCLRYRYILTSLYQASFVKKWPQKEERKISRFSKIPNNLPLHDDIELKVWTKV